MPTSDVGTSNFPLALQYAISAVLLFHLAAIAVCVLAAPSGPWPTGDPGGGQFDPPRFAADAVAGAVPYLQGLKLLNQFHFPFNNVDASNVKLEVRVRDAAGKELYAMTLPDPNANALVRQRQHLLARMLGMDEPYQITSEPIPAEGAAPPKVLVWAQDPDKVFRLKSVEQKSLVGQPDVFRPSELAQLAARSYLRHLGQIPGAATVELLRRSRNPVPPNPRFLAQANVAMFDEMVADFGGPVQ